MKVDQRCQAQTTSRLFGEDVGDIVEVVTCNNKNIYVCMYVLFLDIFLIYVQLDTLLLFWFFAFLKKLVKDKVLEILN